MPQNDTCVMPVTGSFGALAPRQSQCNPKERTITDGKNTATPQSLKDQDLDEVQGAYELVNIIVTSAKDEPKDGRASSFVADSFSFGVE